MVLKYYRKTRPIYLLNGELDGYDTEEITFEVDEDTVIETIFNTYFYDYDFKTFRMIYYEFGIDISDYLTDDVVEKLYKLVV